METNLKMLLKEVRELEKSLLGQIKTEKSSLLYTLNNRKIIFSKKILAQHRLLRKSLFSFFTESSLLSYVVAPVVYSMIVPAVILDIATFFFQTICFSVFKIPKVIRAEYIVLDRHKLRYLNLIERINCDYCSYFNGLIAFVQEVASRTEQYFCPIKHALLVKGQHKRHIGFLEFGDAESYHQKLDDIRKKMKEISPPNFGV